MAAITASLVKELREMTSAGMMDCKKALVEADGDLNKAVEILREKGLSKAAKKAGRIAAMGLIRIALSEDSKTAAIVEVNSETDFVAKNEEFITFVEGMAKLALKAESNDIEAFKAMPYEDSTAQEVLTAKIAKIGENMSIRRIGKASGNVLATYIHSGGSIGVIVAADGADNEANREALKNVAMQVAAMNPQYVSRNDISDEELVSLRRITLESALNDPFTLPRPILNGLLDKVDGVWNKEDVDILAEKRADKGFNFNYLPNFLSEAAKTALATLAIEDKDEGKLYGRDTIEIRMKYGYPILDIDMHKGKALKVIPLDELRRLSWEAYQERQRIDRKFNEARLNNSKPSSTSTHEGWTSLTVEQGMKMSCDTWFNSMLKYNINPHDWERPSLTGQCRLFREVVSKEPDKYIGLIDRAIVDERILLDYPQAGMQGFLDAGRMEEAMHVLEGILGVVGNDVNSDARGFSIHSLLFALNDIPKKEHIPAIVVDLLCNALINAKEPEEDRRREDKDVHTVGINQARGNAGYMLVECARDGRYKEKIFETIESIAEKASVYTRAAILLNMAALNLLDKNRNVVLFKRLMHDYNPRLMSLPVHNYNPLVYFINYAVEEVMDYFKHAADCQECYKGQVVLLWLAWSHNNRDERIKVLLDKMCNNSEEARISLLKFLSTLDQKVNDDGVCYILHILEPQFDSQKMGEACDNLFYHIGTWPEEMQYQITDRYVNSPLCKHHINTFVGYLGGFVIKDPVQTLRWLEQLMNKAVIPDDYFIWNSIADVIIQAYNGIKSFNDMSYKETLEHAMDLIDTIMKSPSNKHLISNFINKLDNE